MNGKSKPKAGVNDRVRRAETRLFLAASCILLLAAFPGCTASSVPGRVNISELDRSVEIVQSALGSPGVSVALVTPQQQIAKAYGLREIGRPEKATSRTSFPIYSVTKIFLGLAAGRMADAGLLSLDDRVATWIPELALSDGEVAARATLRDLLAHGLGVDSADDWIENVPGLSPGDVIARIASQPQATPFREYYYSNVESALLAECLRRAGEAETWQRVVETHVLDPLGLLDTHMSAHGFARRSAIAPTGDGWVEGLVTGQGAVLPGHDISPPQSLWPKGTEHLIGDPRQAGPMVLPFQTSPSDPAQSAFISSHDMVRVLKMLLSQGIHDGKRFLQAETVDALTRVEIPFARDESQKSSWYEEIGSGAPFEIMKIYGERCYGHGGGSLGAQSLIAVCPDIDLGVFVVATGSLYIGNAVAPVLRHVVASHLGIDPQTADFVEAELSKEIDEYAAEEAAFRALVEDMRSEAVPAKDLDAYVGCYRHPFGGKALVRRTRTGLVTRLGPGAEWDLSHIGGNAFLAVWNGPRRARTIQRFEQDGTGAITHAVLQSYTGGEELYFARDLDPSC